MRAGRLVGFPPVPRHPAPLRAPRPGPGPSQSPAHSATPRALSPPRAARRGAATRAAAADRSPQAAGRAGGAVGWRLGGGCTQPPARGAAALLHTRHFLPALLRRTTSCAGRGPDGPAAAASEGLREETGWRELKGMGEEGEGDWELSGSVYLGGSEFVTSLSSPECALPSALAHEWCGKAARGGRDVPWWRDETTEPRKVDCPLLARRETAPPLLHVMVKDF